MDVKYQLVLSVHLWSPVCLRLPSWQRERYVFIPNHSMVNITNPNTAASQLAQQMQAQQMPINPMGGPGQDPDKQFKAEAENLSVIDHYSVLDEVEDRLLARLG